MEDEAIWKAELSGIRVQIDKIDAEIMGLLGERGRLVHKVGELKPHVGAVRVPERERQVLALAEQQAIQNGLDGEFGRQLYLFLLDYFATREEVQVMKRVASITEA